VTVQVGAAVWTIPAGSFVSRRGTYRFSGRVGRARFEVHIMRKGTSRHEIRVHAERVDLGGLGNPVPVQIAIGNDSGAGSVHAKFRK
jgi:hypothetical protein